MRKLILAATFSLFAAAPFAAQAMPIQTNPAPDSGVTLVAGGCGPGFHRGPWGGCRPNRRVWGPGPGFHRCVVRVHRTPWGVRRVRTCR
ncbi:hypothetical protein SLNSH_14830 [Alsobacter soli]|uniref:Uncharacterized protein n=1 Tax=Alsobacter soli TaxID=2109933 RepID=A0A2T1HRK4_9HYPH|nr:hypothetical protein SLNSH_14830 [Alsobacter soli]